jgi:hypothetical protein
MPKYNLITPNDYTLSFEATGVLATMHEVAPYNDRLTALCTSCLNIFRHIAPFLLD